MKRKVALAFLAVCAVTLLLTYSTILAGKYVPLIPNDIFHEQVIANSGCVTCHTPGKQKPLAESHPSGAECMTCHRSHQRH